jgi:hypothetical protein
MAGLRFTFRRGGPGFADDWKGAEVLAGRVEAARRAVREVVHDAADMARDVHPEWEHDTGQLRDAIFEGPTVIEPRAPGEPHVWGYYGVRDTPRWKVDKEGDQVRAGVTNMDVAAFLEFGTARMAPKTPWLYAAWDTQKVRLPELIARYSREIAVSGTPSSIRNELGRFLPHAGILY